MKTKSLHLRLVHCFLFSFFYFLNSSAYATINIVGPDNLCNNNTAVYADSGNSTGGGGTRGLSVAKERLLDRLIIKLLPSLGQPLEQLKYF